MDKEFVQVEKLINELGAGDRFLLRHCGIGKVNAAMTVTKLLLTESVGGVISTGCAGGNGQKVSVGDVVVATAATYHDVFCGAEAAEWDFLGLPERMPADRGLLHAAGLVSADGTPTDAPGLKFGLICTGDQFITTVAEMDKIRQRFPDVLAVDMETASIAHVCHKFGVPFMSLRVISDTPGVDAHTDQYNDFWATMAGRSFAALKNIITQLNSNF